MVLSCIFHEYDFYGNMIKVQYLCFTFQIPNQILKWSIPEGGSSVTLYVQKELKNTPSEGFVLVIFAIISNGIYQANSCSSANGRMFLSLLTMPLHGHYGYSSCLFLKNFQQGEGHFGWCFCWHYVLGKFQRLWLKIR